MSRSPSDVIVVAEPNPVYRHNVAELIYDRTGFEVWECVSDHHAAKWFKTPTDAVPLILITHAYFRDQSGQRDYDRSADLIRIARERTPGLAVIALTNSTIPNRDPARFPDDTQFHDLDIATTEELLKLVDRILLRRTAAV